MELIDELLGDAKERMTKSVESSRGELTTLRILKRDDEHVRRRHAFEHEALDMRGMPPGVVEEERRAARCSA